MRRLLAEFYSWMYGLTKSKLSSYIVGLIYISVMNFVTLNGLALLTRDMFSPMASLLVLFNFPYLIVTFAAICGATWWLTPTAQNVSKDAKKITKHTALILYTVAALVLFLYKHYGEWLFS
ncbi:MAG: hypothetical protein KF744_02480 [Taibaiella sp.]|nr:hypothetical protein [Taibaiella sp.]